VCESCSCLETHATVARGLVVGLGGFDALFGFLEEGIQINAVILRVVIVVFYAVYYIPKDDFDDEELSRSIGASWPLEPATDTANTDSSMRKAYSTTTDELRMSRAYLRGRVGSPEKKSNCGLIG
jgi:hypothetical protein